MTLRAAVKEGLERRGALILLSDVDGTLVPLVDHPHAARLPRRTRASLARLACHPRARIGIVSGRSLRTLKRLVRLPGAAYAGCHGLEIGWRGVRFRHARAAALLPLLRRVTRELRRKTSGYRGILVEPKGLTVSLHYRVADPHTVRAIREIVRRILVDAPALEVLPGKKALELRPRVAWAKGQAVRIIRDLLAKSLGHHSPLTLYLGDDETDEDAFRALRGRALCVAVGRRRTQAAYRVSGPAAIQSLLAWLVKILR